jgi:hypothetical protein
MFGRALDPRRLLFRASPHVALLAVQAWGLSFFAAPLRTIEGFPLDDAWIHQVVARTFATTGTLGYSPGHHGAAATSYLWAILLSLNFKVFHREPFAYTLVLNVALSLLAGQLLLLCLLDRRRDLASILRSTATAALACVGGNYLWFAFSGMEVNLVIALSLACAVAWTQMPGRRGAALTGIAAGALAVTRPECAALGPLLVLWTRRVGRSRGDVAWLLAPWAACLAGYFGANLIATGHLLPSTLSGRLWLWRSVNPGLSPAWLVVDMMSTIGLRLRDYTLGTSATPAFWIGLGLAVYAFVHLIREGHRAVAITIAWMGVHFATYAVLFPTPGHGGRYVPLIPVVYLAGVGYGSLLLIEAALSFVARRLPRRAGLALVGVFCAGALAPWFGLVGVGVRDWRLDNVRATSHIRWTEESMGPLVDALPAGAKVASFDIGGVGFRAHRPILDLGGLSDGATADYLWRGMVWELLRDQHIDYVVVPVGYREGFPDLTNYLYRLRLADNAALRLEPVAYRESPFEVWLPGETATWNSTPRQTLYRVQWTGKPGPEPVSPSPPRSVEDPDELLSQWGRAASASALGMLAQQGVDVSIAVTRTRPPDADRPAATGWRIAMGAWGLVVQAPPADAEVRAYVQGMLVDWSQRLLLDGDFDAATLAATHAFAAAWRHKKSPTFYPLLPPVVGGRAGGPIESTAPWGFALAAAFAAAGLLLDRLSRPKASRVAARARAAAEGAVASGAIVEEPT